MSVEAEPKKEIDFRQRRLVFVDVETTGLDDTRHEIIEIACLVVNPQTLEVEKEYETKIQPEHIERADSYALELNQYSPEAWQEAKSLKKVLEEVNRLAPGGMFAGFNVSFDRGFIDEGSREKGIPLNFDYHWLDVMSIAYKELFFDERLKRLGLHHVCQALGVPHEQAHTAMGDARATLEVYRHLRQESKRAKRFEG